MSSATSAPSLSQHNKPGLLLVHPRLHDPTPSNAGTFFRWTKLHFRDLLDVPDSGSGQATYALRFCAPDSDDKYTHNEKEGPLPKYMYTCAVSDLGYLKTDAYNQVSRKLNLEKTRDLEEGEEGVGFPDDASGEAMVFNVADAKFAVYEEIGLPPPATTTTTETSFQALPTHLTTRGGVAPKSVLVAVHVDLPQGTTAVDVDAVPKALQSSLFNLFKAVVPPALKPYSSLYRWSGEDAQPDYHPPISKDGRGEWMVLVLLVDEEGKTLIREHAVMLVQGWVNEERGKLDGGKIEYGVWEGELFMR